MDEIPFSKLVKGDVVYTLTKDRRSEYPIYDPATITKIGSSKPIPQRNYNPQGNVYDMVIELTVTDSISSLDVILPADKSEGIYNGIYYTTNPNNIISELQLQRNQALHILNNQDKYKAIVEECDRILGSFNPGNSKESKQPSFDEQVLQAMGAIKDRLDKQDSILAYICDTFGLTNKEENNEKLTDK